MKTIRKSVTRRFALTLFLALLTVGGATAGLYFSGYEEVSVWWIAGFLGLVFVIMVWSFKRLVVRPLKIILDQVQLLLTGRPYQKIYTNRIDEVGVLAHFFNEVTKNIETVSVKLKEGEKMQSEMEVASNIQRDVLPEATPQIPGLDVVAKTRFADDLGGDCFGFIRKNKKTLMYIGDVTGHGLPAALVMMMVSTLLDTYTEMNEKALDVVVNTNRQLKPRIKATLFMTMLLLSWDDESQAMSFVGAGHEYLFVYRVATSQVEKIPAGGIALGMVPDNSKLVKEIDLKLEKGDVILLFSDGITEARNEKGEMYGEERLQGSFAEHAPAYNASGILFHISRDFAQFTGEHIQEDDMSMICIKYVGLDAAHEQTEEEKSIAWKDEASGAATGEAAS